MSLRLGETIISGLGSNDGVSITKNSDNEFQTVGVIDQNNTSTSIKTWVGTRSEYITLLNNNQIDQYTLYNITDDVDVPKSLLETIYPVGAIYIGTMNICPLSALFGTWEKVSSGRVLQGSDENHNPGTTIAAGLPNITGEFDTTTWPERQDSARGVFGKKARGGTCFAQGSYAYDEHYFFDASRSSSIYGNSTTVQPPAFVVNIWKRTA